MFAITVTEKGGEQRRLEFDKAEVTIGRVQGNDVILPKGNVSKRHSRIVLKDGKFIVVDLKSTNGTYVNGRKITSPLVVKESDKIYIGDFILGVEEGAGASVAPQPPMPEPPPPAPPVPEPPPPAGNFGGNGAMPPRPAPPSAPPPLAEVPSAASPGPQPGQAPPPPSSPAMPPPPSPSASARAGSAPTAPPPMGAPSGGPPLPSSPPAPSSSPLMSPPMPSPAPSPPSPSIAPAPIAPPAAPTTTGPSAGAKPRLVGAGAGVRRPRPSTSSRRAPVVATLDPKAVKLLELQGHILDRLLPKLDIDDVPLDRLGDETLWQRAESAIVDLVETMDASGDIPKYVDQDQLIKETLNEALGLGPLEDLLADESVSEIIVDRRDRILVSRDGSLGGAGTAFSSDETFRRVVERLVAPTGQRIDEGHPFIDVRLRDGSRVAAAVPPVAVRGACLTLRKPGGASFDLAALIDSGALSGEMADFLATCIVARKNLVVCGAPSSGKSAVLAALAGAAPDGERIVSVEEVAELALDRDDWIALESRPGDGNGLAAVDVGTLLRGALRMRPDRLVVGDVRGGEALELVQAMASSCDGTFTSITGEGGRAALARLAAMARLGAPGSTLEATRELVACAVDIVVHVARYADGVFRIASIEEVVGVGEDGFATRELFSFRGSSDDGGFAAAGVVPTFYGELESRGIPADTSIFRT